MGWLFVEKIWPTLRQGERPQYSEVLPSPAAPPRHACWEIQYDGKPIGQATSVSLREVDGSGRMQSSVHFGELPLSEIMNQLLGPAARLIAPLFGNSEDIRINMAIDSDMHISEDGNLQSFTTDVRFADLPNTIRIEGEVNGSKLEVTVLMADEKGDMRPHYRDEIELAREAMVSGAFSPQDRLTRLRVGQTWTVPVYRPFPPNSPVQILEAKVERQEAFIWNGEALRAFQVVYRDDAGSGITIARQPIGEMWVREDGVVLQQEARVANMQFRFVRLPDDDCQR